MGANEFVDSVETLKAPVQRSFSPHLYVGTVLFIAATIGQTISHYHLHHQLPRPNYILPTHPLFRYTLTPHYFAECLEYLGLAIAGASEDWINKTLATALVFVVVNLGVTAYGSRKWYAQRFGESVIRDRARMVPFVW
jgi:3-oxo-5-alpha-steroid 4-dehydrogenase 3